MKRDIAVHGCASQCRCGRFRWGTTNAVPSGSDGAVDDVSDASLQVSLAVPAEDAGDLAKVQIATPGPRETQGMDGYQIDVSRVWHALIMAAQPWPSCECLGHLGVHESMNFSTRCAMSIIQSWTGVKPCAYEIYTDGVFQEWKATAGAVVLARCEGKLAWVTNFFGNLLRRASTLLRKGRPSPMFVQRQIRSSAWFSTSRQDVDEQWLLINVALYGIRSAVGKQLASFTFGKQNLETEERSCHLVLGEQGRQHQLGRAACWAPSNIGLSTSGMALSLSQCFVSQELTRTNFVKTISLSTQGRPLSVVMTCSGERVRHICSVSILASIAT